MRALILALMGLTIGAQAQTLEQRINPSVTEELRAAQRSPKSRRVQCTTATGDEALCDCLARNLPIVLDFVNYVALVTQPKDALEYDKLSENDRRIVDNVHIAREKCTKR